MVISAAENDGIYIWQFHGDTHSNFHPPVDEAADQQALAIMDQLHEPTVLERMRASVREKRKPKLAEFSFILPEFKLQDRQEAGLSSLSVAVPSLDSTGIT